MKILGILLAFATLTGCIGGGAVSNVNPETKDDMAACGMGINSSSNVALKAAVELEKYSGEISGGLKDELATEFSKHFSQADALKAMEQYLVCMKTRVNDRRAEKKQSAITACKAAWTCDSNQAAGYCTCNEVVREVQKERNLSELQAAKLIKSQCSFDFQQCWPGQNLQKGRSDCEATLSQAGIALPKKSATKTCTYDWPSS